MRQAQSRLFLKRKPSEVRGSLSLLFEAKCFYVHIANDIAQIKE